MPPLSANAKETRTVGELSPGPFSACCMGEAWPCEIRRVLLSISTCMIFLAVFSLIAFNYVIFILARHYMIFVMVFYLLALNTVVIILTEHSDL